MKVGIVGAGISGLAAARTLSQAGIDAVVWERQEYVGGRVETYSEQGFTFDTGATSVAPRGMAIEQVILRELPTDQLVKIAKPIFTHNALRITAGDPRKNATDRYTWRPGNAELPKLLARDLMVRTGAQIEEITRSGQAFIVQDEAYDALILTPPIPQTSLLLWSLRESRPVGNAKYRSCLSIMLGYDVPTPETHYHAILDVEQRHPLTWVTIESAKCPGRAPEGKCALVAQMSPSYSLMRYSSPDQEILDDVLVYIARIYGDEFSSPVFSKVRRWKYSLPDSVADFSTVNHEGARLVLAGDGLLAGRVESAYESGVKAANLLLHR